ncbi:MAG TPA: prolyl oligopeptidase family serine peptidase [Opitutaceae bacterium]|nr:prolyl oligopeptidase family serine peptidase [Opitutaceae bacterium]
MKVIRLITMFFFKFSLLPALALFAGHALAADSGTWVYPAAPRGATIDNYFGTKVSDPYRWLEDIDSPQTQVWVAAQNRLTFDFLGKRPQRAALRARLEKLWNYPRYGLPFKEGGRYFFLKNNGLQNQSVLYVQPSLAAAPRLLLDPNTFAQDGTIALTQFEVSPDGKWLAYGLAAAGSDWTEFHVRGVVDGQDTTDVIKWVKFSGLAWTKDSAGFFYSRFPETSAAGETYGELAHQKLYYHRLGRPQSADRVIAEIPDQPKWLLTADTTEDGRYAIISVERGDKDENLLRYIDLGDPHAPRLDAPVAPLVDTWDAQCSVVGNEGPVFFVLTNLEAPRWRIIAIDTRAPGRKNWKTVVPEGPDVIESAQVIGGRFVVKTLHDAQDRLAVYAFDGTPRGEIPLPGIGAVGEDLTGNDTNGISGRADEPGMFYRFESFSQPRVIFHYNLDTEKNETWQATPVDFDPGAYETTQVFYASKDGTRVPMFITHKKGLKLDGTNPTMLYGYGGFDISLTPSVRTPAPLWLWLELGGVYAQPNLRGGGEYGEAWHLAGTKERKQNVFDDFIAAAEWLFKNGYTSPSHLLISGGSNGGLLIGAVVNQRPDLCRVAWPAVGVMDMLRFQKFTIGWAWVADYGSSEDPAAFKYLYAYSPLHNVKPGVKYPAIFVTTADHDDRVYPAHSFKYTAALQAATEAVPGSGPVLIRIETRGGHGAGRPTSKLIDENADKLAFALHFLGLDLKQ